MMTLGVVEVRRRLATLLSLVAAGEEVTITKYGRPVARLIKADDAARNDIDLAIEKLKAMRSGVTLGSYWHILHL